MQALLNFLELRTGEGPQLEICAYAETLEEILELTFPEVAKLAIEPKKLRAKFDRLKKAWLDETEHFSNIKSKIINLKYREIIKLGKPVVPLILESMLSEQDYWFEALEEILGDEAPVIDRSTFESATLGWLKWGKENCLL